MLRTWYQAGLWKMMDVIKPWNSEYPWSGTNSSSSCLMEAWITAFQRRLHRKKTKNFLNWTPQMSSHIYTIDRDESDCRFYVLLGITWHVKGLPSVHYVRTIVISSDVRFCASRYNKMEPFYFTLKLINLNVKKVGRMLKKSHRIVFKYFKNLPDVCYQIWSVT